MDDATNLLYVSDASKEANVFSYIWKLTLKDVQGWGIFRPIYWLWVVFGYGFFKSFPLGMHIFVASLNMLFVCVWGWLFCKFYEVEDENRAFFTFLYPLTFFVFTPFWNMFMYLSLQEKFIFYFAPAAMFFFQQSFTKDIKKIYISLLFVVLSILSKPTAVYMVAAFLGYSILVLLINKDYRRQAISNTVVWGIFFILYTIFVFKVQLKGGYLANYKEGMTLLLIVQRLKELPIVLKCLMSASVLGSIAYLIKGTMNRDKIMPIGIILYFSFAIYLGSLLPWGIVTYHLCFLPPFIAGMFLPIVLFMLRYNKYVRPVFISVLAALIFMTQALIIYPRIRTLSDIKSSIQFVKENKEKYHFIFTGSFIETAETIRHLADPSLDYIAEAEINSTDLLDYKTNVLLNNDTAGLVNLVDVTTSESVYSNDTWNMIALKKSRGNIEKYAYAYPKNFMQKIKNFLKNK